MRYLLRRTLNQRSLSFPDGFAPKTDSKRFAYCETKYSGLRHIQIPHIEEAADNEKSKRNANWNRHRFSSHSGRCD